MVVLQIETEKNSVNLYLVVLKKSALDNIMTTLVIIWKNTTRVLEEVTQTELALILTPACCVFQNKST